MRKLFTTLTIVAVSLLFSNSVLAQNVTITGTVSDKETSETLIGVSVILKGSTTGTTTDANGKYRISAPLNGTLVFTYLGFSTQEVPVNNQTVVNVQLGTSATQLEQVVVVGYGTQKKRDLTGSISTVKGEELAKMPATNPDVILTGKSCRTNRC